MCACLDFHQAVSSFLIRNDPDKTEFTIKFFHCFQHLLFFFSDQLIEKHLLGSAIVSRLVWLPLRDRSDLSVSAFLPLL